MCLKASLFFLTLFVGIYAFPAAKEDNTFSDYRGVSSRIIGGTVAERVPYMVGIVYGTVIRSLTCGGSLITNRHVLTAAHCIRITNGALTPSMRGVIGSNNWRTGIQIAFLRAILHPDYDLDTIKNDIGILVSTATIPLSNNIKLVNLRYTWADGGVAATVYGWGITENNAGSEVLLRLDTEVISGEKCQNIINSLSPDGSEDIFQIDDKIEICTSSPVGKGICSSDSGSPLVRSENNEQIGIVSWGFRCGSGAPDGYARVTAYKDWIESIIL